MINNSGECLICLEKCTQIINLECCGEYNIHKECYNKWIKQNKICLICRNPITENTSFVIHYITLAQIKLLLSCYCVISSTLLLYIIIVCDLSTDYCDLM
jgi:hypothetical protein